MEINKINNIEDVKELNYSELVGLLKERNKPSGGLKSIVEVSNVCRLTKGDKILEIGSNTGFTSVNLALLNKDVEVTGIDINSNSVNESTNFAKLNHIDENVSFMVQNSEKLNFIDNEFNLVWSSNVTSFISNKKKAVEEYLRVLDFGGYLILIPIYYIKTPSSELLDKVSKAINSKIDIRTKSDWINFFYKTANNSKNCYLEKIYEKDYVYNEQTSKRMDEYCNEILDNSDLNFTTEINNEIFKKYVEHMNLFNDNLQHCGYSIIIFQKRHIKDESELFLSREV
ncbi:MAG: class I SAM-dependent methyltransferase [Nanoarchaeales archaeon]|nr:class I SAM-dependent methyltransferase [Nanoarchaeales archaeon]